MQENQLNPTMEFKEKVWEALSDFNKKTGILIETIEVIHMDISSISSESKAWVMDRMEVHFKTGVCR